jgi:peptide/nickel transport system substrate-binding protein
MHRKSLLSLFMLSMGVALIAAAMAVGAASAKTQRSASGGTLIVTQAGTGFDTLDPQLSYVSNDWGLLYNTEITLLNFPTKAGSAGTQLIPQAATAFPTISDGGKQYVFHIRPGLKLSDGTPITAANFQRSFERNLSPKMFAQYGIYDGLDQFLVGGTAFANGKTKHISGIDANGLTLTIHLTKVVPQFTTIMGMPWFQAIPSNLPYNNTAGGILKYASGGPYYISSNNNQSLTVLKRNKFFPSTPYFTSNWPSNPLSIVVKSNVNSDGTPELLQAEKNQVDLAGVASQDVSSVVKKYGVNKGQFHVGPTTCITWNALNNQAADGSTSKFDVRKALNYGLSRNAINSFAGAYAGTPSEQVLVPAIPGYKKITYYGGAGNLAKAKQVGGSDLKGAQLNIYYRDTSNYQKAVAEYIESQAGKLGMKPALQNSDPTGYYHPLMTKSIATGPGGYNITASGGWCADYADGYDYINVNFDGRTIGPTGNTDYEYFNNAQFNKDMDHAASLTGKARATAYGNLDAEFMHNYAPIIPDEISNTRIFASKRVHNWVYSTWWGQPFWNAIKIS